jgi:hypothetical protein
VQVAVPGKRIVGTQHHSDRVRPQYVDEYPGRIERRTSERDVDQSGPQASSRVSEIGLVDTDGHARMAAAKGGYQLRSGLLRTVGDDPDGDGRGARGRGHPCASLLGPVEQGAGLLVQQAPAPVSVTPARERCSRTAPNSASSCWKRWADFDHGGAAGTRPPNRRIMRPASPAVPSCPDLWRIRLLMLGLHLCE